MNLADYYYKKRLRGDVLALLAKEYPGTIDSVVLSALLEDLHYPAAHEIDFVYLAEKGYMIKTQRRVETFKIVFYCITAAGIDLHEGTTTDAGIDTRRSFE